VLPGGARSLSASERWRDPVIGIRVLAPIAERWSFVGYVDIGGFGVGSDITCQAIAGANWQFCQTLAAKVGLSLFLTGLPEQRLRLGHGRSWSLRRLGDSLLTAGDSKVLGIVTLGRMSPVTDWLSGAVARFSPEAHLAYSGTARVLKR
jgi:hypothetical protein